MNYYQLLFTTLTTEDHQQDMLINTLGEIGFDSFEELEFGFNAYIPAQDFDQEHLDDALILYRHMFTFSYEIILIPHKNWNQVWESNFEPIAVKNKVYVRATFHQPQPKFAYEIVIDPKMAFGTGHHQTTLMMLELMLENEFTGKTVLDMGCGTGILAIMASKLKAAYVTAIDNDLVCYHSTLENTQLNCVHNVQVLCGSEEIIPDGEYDVILANINRNILLGQMKRYGKVLKPGGEIFLSGFYETPDLDMIRDEAGRSGIKYIGHQLKDSWVAARFMKQALPGDSRG